MTTTCPACGSTTTSSACSRCGFMTPSTPVALAKTEPPAAATDTALFDATIARSVASGAFGTPPPTAAPETPAWPTVEASVSATPPPWQAEQVAPTATALETPPPWQSSPPPWQGPAASGGSGSTSTVSTVVAHLVLWLGLLLVALTAEPLFRLFAKLDFGITAAFATAAIVSVLPVAVALVIAGRSATLRVTALVGGLAILGVVGYYATTEYSTVRWPVPLAVCVVGLATWMVARRHARTGYLLLIPAALVLLLWFPSFGPGQTLQSLPYRHGVSATILLSLWSDLPVLVMAGFGLVSSLLRPAPPREKDAVGWAVVGPLALVMLLLLPITSAISTSASVDYNGSADYSTSPTTGSTPDYTGASVDPAAAASAYLDAAEAGQSYVAGCNGDVATPSVASYTIGQVSPATSGGFDVSADVTAADGSTTTVTVHIGPTVGANGQACVESASTPDYTGGTSDQAGSNGFPVPSVPSSGDPVPNGGTVPVGTVTGAVIPYTDSGRNPTTESELVAYQPTGLTGDETAAVQGLIRFLTAINQQDFQSAWNASTYSTKGPTYSSGFAAGYVTSRHFEVSFGQPQVLSSTLIAVPATFVSRQNPAAQGNPSGVTSCTFWPQYVFLAANVGGVWLDDTAGVYSSDPSVAPLKRPDPSRPGKVALNPLSQRVAC